jgi:hypothetical protein
MISTILIPTRPQPDTLVAIYLIKRYGNEHFPGIDGAQVITQSSPMEQSEETLEQQGMIVFDIGGGRFDHHGKPSVTTCSQLVADFLGINEESSIKKLLDYAYRDDTQGKGTVSTDVLDRAFGLSGLIAALNKKFPGETQYIVNLILPLIEAHHDEETRRFKEFPEEITRLQNEGKFGEMETQQRDKKLRIVFTESDTMGLPGYLRSQLGGRYDLVVQRLSSGHVNILTRPTKRPDLRSLIVALRTQEFQYVNNRMILLSDSELSKSGRIDDVPNWYYDPATNSLQNGGANPGTIAPTKIPWDQFPSIIQQNI